jgi:hypothetical protein
LSGPDVLDVTAVIQAFEQINTCRITVLGSVADRDGLQTLCWIISAQEDLEDVPEQKYLASVNVSMNGGGHRTIEGAIMWALYQLDWQLSKHEIARTHKTA